MFIHLRTHSHYSLLKALPKIHPLVARAKALGMSSLALTDYSNMYGTIEFYKACKDAKIKPIIGVEFSMLYNERLFKITLLAKNIHGYKNLMRITSVVNMENSESPVLSFETLITYKEGIIVLSGGPWGDISTLLTIDKKQALLRLHEYQKHFENHFYLEITPHTFMDRGDEMRNKTISFAREHNIPLIATWNSHYIQPQDKAAHKTLYSVHGDQTSLDEYQILFQKGDFHFASEVLAK